MGWGSGGGMLPGEGCSQGSGGAPAHAVPQPCFPPPKTSSSPSRGFGKVVLVPLFLGVSAQGQGARPQPPSLPSMQGGPKGPGLSSFPPSLHPGRAPRSPRSTHQGLHPSRSSAQGQILPFSRKVNPIRRRRGYEWNFSQSKVPVLPTRGPAPLPRTAPPGAVGRRGQLEPLAVPITVPSGCWHLGCGALVPAL